MENNEQLVIMLEEYKSLREEIISDNNASFTNTSTALAALTAILTILFASSSSEKPIWLLLTPSIFYVLNLYQLRLALMTNNISHYIAEDLTPRIKKVLEESHKDFVPFCWEETARRPKHSNIYLFMFIEAARYGLPLFFALLMIVFYLLLIYSMKFELSIFDCIISFVNFVGLIISGIIVIYVRKYLREVPKRTDKRRH